MKRCYVVILLLLAGTAPAAHAQSVAGRALAAADRQPIAHAFVVLLDERGQTRGGALSDSIGRWLIRAPVTGRYRLRLERIGYENVESDWLQLTDSLRLYDFIVAERPFTLDAVRAESGGRGCAARADAEAVYRLWEEVQKALRLTRWTESNSSLSFTTMTYVRETNAQLTKVLSESRRMRTARAAAPFGTLAPAELMARGFSRNDGEGVVLLGVDARVLLSPEFVEQYCFRIQPSAQPDLIGLGFEPMRRRGTTDVRGVLWVDRRSAELRYLTYQYVDLPAAISGFDASAEVHFRRLTTGMWVIDRWWIRGPRLQERQVNVWSSRSQSLVELAGYHEDGGVLMVAEDRTRSVFQLVGGAALDGTVVDRPASAAGNATAFLSGTPHFARIDAAGRFRIVGVPPGKYGLTARDSLLDDLRLPSRVDSVQLTAGQTTTHTIRWPSQIELLRSVCPGEEEEAGDEYVGLLYGDVVHPRTGAPLSNAQVQVTWGRVDPARGMEQRSRTSYTAADGRYYLCWISVRAELTLQVSAADGQKRELQVYLATPAQRQDVR